jgi:WD40 repeat protein
MKHEMDRTNNMNNINRLNANDVFIQECGVPHGRNASFSVSFNSTGLLLASGSGSNVKLWPIDASSSQHTIREISTFQHNALMDRVRFHPADPSLLCTSAEDKTVQLWDVRDKATKSLAKINLKSSQGLRASSIEWHPQYLAVTEKDNSVHIYDLKMLKSNSNSGREKDTVASFKFDDVIHETHFSPSGTHLVSAGRRLADGMGIVNVFKWQDINNSNDEMHQPHTTTFIGHSGPIYSLRFSPNGNLMATGGNDAIVGLWDVPSMVCQATITRQTKFIRSVAFSHDSKIVASCSEEEGIDLADAKSGEHIGTVSLWKSNERARYVTGSDEIAWSPNAYILAAARGEGNPQVPQVSVAKIQYNHNQ